MLKDQSSVIKDHPRKSYILRAVRYGARFIEYPVAFAGAMIMGAIVAFINRKYGFWPSTTAALKQAVYTFFFGGLLTRLLYSILNNFRGRVTSIIVSTITVTVITVILVYFVHTMKGTPMPFESTLPTAFLAPFGFSFLAWRKMRRA
jgi:hypothetical protein